MSNKTPHVNSCLCLYWTSRVEKPVSISCQCPKWFLPPSVSPCHWPAHSLDVWEGEVDRARGPSWGVTRELGLGDQGRLLQGLHHRGWGRRIKGIFFCFTSDIKSPFLQIFKHLTKWQNIQIKTLYDLWVSFQSSNKPLTPVRLSSKRDLMFWISQQS